MSHKALPYRGRTGTSVDRMSAALCPSQSLALAIHCSSGYVRAVTMVVLSRLTLEILDVCAVTAAKGVSGSALSMLAVQKGALDKDDVGEIWLNQSSAVRRRNASREAVEDVRQRNTCGSHVCSSTLQLCGHANQTPPCTDQLDPMEVRCEFLLCIV